MKPGPKPKPTADKEMRGNPGKRSLNANEPRPPVARPSAPLWLSDAAKLVWAEYVDQLADVGLMTYLDVGALAAYCVTYARWQEAEQALRRMGANDPATHGYVIKTSNKNFIQNPLLNVANAARDSWLKLAEQFGMTPSARSRLEVDVPTGPHVPIAPRQPGAQPAASLGADRFFH